MERQRAEMLIKIARVRLECGRTGDALNYLYQAQSLYPTRTAAGLIQAIRGGYFEADGGHGGPTHGHYEQRDFWAHQNHYAGCGNCGRPAWEEEEDDDEDEEEEDEEDEEEEKERVIQGFDNQEDYYRVLGVRRDANTEVIRKSYRKLALRYHPDKNSSAGATEAFKVIGKAFAVLSDPTKRKAYDYSQGRAQAPSDQDLTTDEIFDLFFRGHFSARAAYAFSGRPREPPRSTRRDEPDGTWQRWSSEDDMQDRPRWQQRESMRQNNGQDWRPREETSQERRRQWQEQKQEGGQSKGQKDVKREPGRPKTQQERKQDVGQTNSKWWEKKGQEPKKSRWREEMEKHNIKRPRRQEEEEEAGTPKSAYSAFIQVLPVLILVVVSVVAQMTATTPSYSLHPKSSYGLTVPRETSSRGVPYFVGQNFQNRYRGQALVELERAVEKEYAEQVQAGCWKEKQQRSDLANLARLYGDQRLREKADSFKMENCRKLSDLIGIRRGG
ncbi:dnaJ homolog subfamily C member 18-like [Bufo gargarizans]|uniref:dnaJ homolog subfamily C member 18-like n=1 Tax=Bufo gargarizans TaxID=30331 RepID=UPI001CF26C5C|nr:dnaJ homolog subfamily C member 18-like [Bufo gargarizans]